MIKIYHYKDRTSDKIWAMNTVPISAGEYEVFYGRRTCVLTRRVLKTRDDPYEKIQKKIGKGYRLVEGIISTKSEGIVFIEYSSEKTNSIQPASNKKPKKRPKKIVNLSKINTENHSAFF